MSDLTLDEYQRLADTTAVYPGKGTILGLIYVSLGLGEAGEAQGKVKKVLRDDLEFEDGVYTFSPDLKLTDDRREQIKSEASDILWYLAALSTELEMTLGELAEYNLHKLFDRKERGVLKGSGDNR